MCCSIIVLIFESKQNKIRRRLVFPTRQHFPRFIQAIWTFWAIHKSECKLLHRLSTRHFTRYVHLCSCFFNLVLTSSVMQLIFLCANQGLFRVTLCHYISRKGNLEPIRRFLKGRLEILHSRSFPHSYHYYKLLKTQLPLRWTPTSLTYWETR